MERKLKKKKLSVNLENCKYKVVRDETLRYGMQITEDATNWSLFWIDTGVSYERILEMKSYQRINHFPGMHEICRKDQLARKATRLARLFPKDYNFFPASWTMPSDWNEFQRQHKTKKGQCYISKPDHGCQGKGIFLFKEPEDIAEHKKTEIVVQSYISNPCLINGFKFDFRVYVLVTSVNPLRIFVYDDGLARFATEPYQTPNEKNMERMCMHLTNYAVNKNSKGFVRDEEKGSKRTIQSVLNELEEIDKDQVWKRIQDAVIKTVLLVQPQLSKLMKPWFPSDEKISFNHMGSQCFEILGFDVMLDSKMKPWVLEVNHSPSFSCDSPLDLEMKSGVIQGALKLVNVNGSAQKKYHKDQKQKSLSRLFPSKPKLAEAEQSMTKQPMERKDSNTTVVQEEVNEESVFAKVLEKYHKLYNPAALEKLSKWEDERCGKYQRVFPPTDTEQLGKYLSLIQDTSEWSTQTNTLKARKKLVDAKLEQEQEQSKKLEQWKSRQKQKRVQPRISCSAKGRDRIRDEMLEMKRMISPTPSILVRKPIREKNTIPLKVQTLNDQFNFGGSLSTTITNYYSFPQPSTNNLEEFQDLMNTNPLIKQKQFELSQITTTMNGRKVRK